MEREFKTNKPFEKSSFLVLTVLLRNISVIPFWLLLKNIVNKGLDSVVGPQCASLLHGLVVLETWASKLLLCVSGF